ncbi:MAG: D-alanyl-D-alanine carboxypeptidase [Alphaproteobacteria bacterium]|nr:D-alanyl-D-alanine carboxypeptidase [Alphaproteobacteria bacterium]
MEAGVLLVNKTSIFSKWSGFFSTVVFVVGILTVPADARAGYASFVVDADNGRVIHSDRADVRNHPASLTKMMTLYLLFEALDQGQVKMSSRVSVSANAAKQAPSRLGVPVGETLSVEEAILALVTKSANDVACATAEFLGGSEARFAAAMTAKARSLGMKQTEFRNASGLPNPGQVTSARDMATLARALIKRFPQYYHYFSTREFNYGPTKITTHNRLLLSYEGADGLKTGYIGASGFNLVTSAKRDGRRLVGVVLGGRTSRWRDQHMADLLDASFAQLTGQRPPLTARVAPPPSDGDDEAVAAKSKAPAKSKSAAKSKKSSSRQTAKKASPKTEPKTAKGGKTEKKPSKKITTAKNGKASLPEGSN